MEYVSTTTSTDKPAFYKFGIDKKSVNWFIDKYLTPERGYTVCEVTSEKDSTDITAIKYGCLLYSFELKQRFCYSTTFGDNVCEREKVERAKDFSNAYLITFYADNKFYYNDLKSEKFEIKERNANKCTCYTPNNKMVKKNLLSFQQHNEIVYKSSDIYTDVELEYSEAKHKKFHPDYTPTTTPF